MRFAIDKLTRSLLVTTAFITTNCTGQPDYVATGEHKVKFKGNEFTYENHGMKDTLYLLDPVTGQTRSKIIDVAQVATMNGKKIYEMNEVEPPPLTDNISAELEEYLLKNLIQEPWLLKFDDGMVRVALWDFVVDETGKIVYYSNGGMTYMGRDNTTRTLGDGGQTEQLIANYPALKSFTINNTKVTVRLNVSLLQYTIVLKNHTATYTRGNLFALSP